MEVGSVGLAENSTFYAHTEESEVFFILSWEGESIECQIINYFFLKSGRSVQVSDATQELLNALQYAASSLSEENASSVELASKSNPGVPPSSFMSFLNEVIYQSKHLDPFI